MTWITQVKLGLLLAGLVIFAWGARIDHTPVRWIGIGVIAVAFALRFLRSRGQNG